MKENDRRSSDRNRGSIAVDAMLRCLRQDRVESPPADSEQRQSKDRDG